MFPGFSAWNRVGRVGAVWLGAGVLWGWFGLCDFEKVLPASAASCWCCVLLSQKIQKRRKRSLTVWEGGAYIRLNNEGGAPLATKKFASKFPG